MQMIHYLLVQVTDHEDAKNTVSFLLPRPTEIRPRADDAMFKCTSSNVKKRYYTHSGDLHHGTSGSSPCGFPLLKLYIRYFEIPRGVGGKTSTCSRKRTSFRDVHSAPLDGRYRLNFPERSTDPLPLRVPQTAPVSTRS